jgi:hypothetical protein
MTKKSGIEVAQMTLALSGGGHSMPLSESQQRELIVALADLLLNAAGSGTDYDREGIRHESEAHC